MERLSGTDAAFVAFEEADRPMHVGLLALCEAGDEGGAERCLRELPDLIARLPRFRQRLVRHGRLHWVDAPGFEARHHVQALSLRIAGDSLAQSDAVAHVFARPLDPNRPLWEVWVISGLDAGERFAVLIKVHHCMLDGSAGLSALEALVGPADESSRHLRARRDRSSRGRRSGRSVRRALHALLRLLMRTWDRTTATPFNGRSISGIHLATTSFELAAIQHIARGRGATANDVLLALIGGTLGRVLAEEGFDRASLRLRALCPVDLRSDDETSRLGNRLGAWLVELPVDHDELEARVRAARFATKAARDGSQDEAVELLGEIGRFAPRRLPRFAMRLAGRLRVFNLLVTHLHGPDRPLELLGARVTSLVPLAPIFAGQRCSLAALRYAGRLHLGLTVGWRDRTRTQRMMASLEAELEGALGVMDESTPTPEAIANAAVA